MVATPNTMDSSCLNMIITHAYSKALVLRNALKERRLWKLYISICSPSDDVTYIVIRNMARNAEPLKKKEVRSLAKGLTVHAACVKIPVLEVKLKSTGTHELRI